MEDILNDDPIGFRAAWIFPGDGPPIENGIVVVAGNTIREVGPFQPQSVGSTKIVDLGDGAIIPGLINAHTHLEFSDLIKPLGDPGIPFTDWIRLIVAYRNQATQRQPKQATIAEAISESFAKGTWAIGEIATLPTDFEPYAPPDPSFACRVFLEQLGRNPAALAERQLELKQFWDSANSENRSVQFAASPHAPYSVAPALLAQICEQAARSEYPVAMHVAETREERELLASQSGPFVELLKDFGVWDPQSFRPPQTIMSILERLDEAPRSLVVHGNYLTSNELDFIASRKTRMAIVFCPRTHAYFQHARYPLMEMFSRGIRVALGTDSRASNPDLDLFAEMKKVRQQFEELPTAQILQMATTDGATALGLTKWGALAAGNAAALSFVTQPGRGTVDSPERWLLEPATVCRPIQNSPTTL